MNSSITGRSRLTGAVRSGDRLSKSTERHVPSCICACQRSSSTSRRPAAGGAVNARMTDDDRPSGRAYRTSRDSLICTSAAGRFVSLPVVVVVLRTLITFYRFTSQSAAGRRRLTAADVSAVVSVQPQPPQPQLRRRCR